MIFKTRNYTTSYCPIINASVTGPVSAMASPLNKCFSNK